MAESNVCSIVMTIVIITEYTRKNMLGIEDFYEKSGFAAIVRHFREFSNTVKITMEQVVLYNKWSVFTYALGSWLSLLLFTFAPSPF